VRWLPERLTPLRQALGLRKLCFVIQGYEPTQPLPPENEGHFQWFAALKAGAAAGLVFLVIARGNPWAGLTFSSPVVMGRVIPPNLGMPLAASWLIHLCISLLYGAITALAVTRLSHWRAIITGGVVGLVLYCLNRSVVHVLCPALEGQEAGVAFTHVVFGMVAAGAYRGLLKRQAPASTR